MSCIGWPAFSVLFLMEFLFPLVDFSAKGKSVLQLFANFALQKQMHYEGKNNHPPGTRCSGPRNPRMADRKGLAIPPPESRRDLLAV